MKVYKYIEVPEEVQKYTLLPEETGERILTAMKRLTILTFYWLVLPVRSTASNGSLKEYHQVEAKRPGELKNRAQRQHR